MWVVHLMLTLAALYAVIIAGMYFAQTRLLFPTMFAGPARVQLPASTQRLHVGTPDCESLAGVRIPPQGVTPCPGGYWPGQGTSRTAERRVAAR